MRWGWAGYRTGSGHGAAARRPVGPSGPRLGKGARESAGANFFVPARGLPARTFGPSAPPAQRASSAPGLAPSAQHLRARRSDPCKGLCARAAAGPLLACLARDDTGSKMSISWQWPREWPWAGLWPLRLGAHRARSGGGRPSVAESARGKPGPNGMAGRHGSFEQAQGSPNAGRAPGGAGTCGQLTGPQPACSDG